MMSQWESRDKLSECHAQVIPKIASTETRWRGGSAAPTIVQGEFRDVECSRWDTKFSGRQRKLGISL